MTLKTKIMVPRLEAFECERERKCERSPDHVCLSDQCLVKTMEFLEVL